MLARRTKNLPHHAPPKRNRLHLFMTGVNVIAILTASYGTFKATKATNKVRRLYWLKFWILVAMLGGAKPVRSSLGVLRSVVIAALLSLEKSEGAVHAMYEKFAKPLFHESETLYEKVASYASDRGLVHGLPLYCRLAAESSDRLSQSQLEELIDSVSTLSIKMDVEIRRRRHLRLVDSVSGSMSTGNRQENKKEVLTCGRTMRKDVYESGESHKLVVNSDEGNLMMSNQVPCRRTLSVEEVTHSLVRVEDDLAWSATLALESAMSVSPRSRSGRGPFGYDELLWCSSPLQHQDSYESSEEWHGNMLPRNSSVQSNSSQESDISNPGRITVMSTDYSLPLPSHSNQVRETGVIEGQQSSKALDCHDISNSRNFNISTNDDDDADVIQVMRKKTMNVKKRLFPNQVMDRISHFGSSVVQQTRSTFASSSTDQTEPIHRIDEVQHEPVDIQIQKRLAYSRRKRTNSTVTDTIQRHEDNIMSANNLATKTNTSRKPPSKKRYSGRLSLGKLTNNRVETSEPSHLSEQKQ